MGRNGVSAYFYCKSHDHPGSTGFVNTDSNQAMQPIYGRLSDIFGRKVVLLASLTVFWIGSLACALAQVSIPLLGDV
jgi:MFS family permease